MITTFRELYDKLAVIYCESFLKKDEDTAYDLLTNYCANSCFSFLYKRFLAEDGIAPIEDLPQDKKETYWKISCKYFEENKRRIEGVKMVYMLNLITGKNG